MVHCLQGQISTLTTQINHLVEQAANDTLYKTVDQTNAIDSSQSLGHSFEHNSATNIEDEPSQESNGTNNAHSQIIIEDLPTPNVQLPDLQPHLYSEVVRTSTPRNATQQTPQRRPRPVPRRRQETSLAPPSPQPIPQNVQKEILLIGDSLISSINSKGLVQNVFRNGIPGATIREVLNQIKVFDLKKFSHVVIYIGGNDASSGSDPEFFEEIYDQVVKDFEQCVFPAKHQRKTRSSHQVKNSRRNHLHNRPVRVQTNGGEHFCYKCGENNHETTRCRHSEQLKCFHCNYYGHKSYRCLNK